MRGQQGLNGGRELDPKMEAFCQRCRQARRKVTPQRMAVYKALLETKEHPSAETVFRRIRWAFPSISLDTVNRTLLTLNDMGVAFIVEGSGDAKRYDANLEVHQHFKCVACRRIIDFRHPPFDEIDIPKNLKARFSVLRATVYLEGLCNACRRDAKSAAKAPGKES